MFQLFLNCQQTGLGSIEDQDENGSTPLSLALKLNKRRLFNFLLRDKLARRAVNIPGVLENVFDRIKDSFLVDKEGWYPIHYLARNSSLGQTPGVVCLFLMVISFLLALFLLQASRSQLSVSSQTHPPLNQLLKRSTISTCNHHTQCQLFFCYHYII